MAYRTAWRPGLRLSRSRRTRGPGEQRGAGREHPVQPDRRQVHLRVDVRGRGDRERARARAPVRAPARVPARARVPPSAGFRGRERTGAGAGFDSAPRRGPRVAIPAAASTIGRAGRRDHPRGRRRRTECRARRCRPDRTCTSPSHRVASEPRTLSPHGDEGTACMCAHRGNRRPPRGWAALQRDGWSGAGLVGEHRSRVRRGRGRARPSPRGVRPRRARARDPPGGAGLPARAATGRCACARSPAAGAGLLVPAPGRGAARGGVQRGTARTSRAPVLRTPPSSKATPTTPPRRCTVGSSRSPAGTSCGSRSPGARGRRVGPRPGDRDRERPPPPARTGAVRRRRLQRRPHRPAGRRPRGRRRRRDACATEDRLHQDRRLARSPHARRDRRDARRGRVRAWLSGSGPSVARSGRRGRGHVAPALPATGRALVLDIDDEGATVRDRRSTKGHAMTHEVIT